MATQLLPQHVQDLGPHKDVSLDFGRDDVKPRLKLSYRAAKWFR